MSRQMPATDHADDEPTTNRRPARRSSPLWAPFPGVLLELNQRCVTGHIVSVRWCSTPLFVPGADPRDPVSLDFPTLQPSGN
jgi:hypothetical protein